MKKITGIRIELRKEQGRLTFNLLLLILIPFLTKSDLKAQAIDDTTIQWVMYWQPNDTLFYRVNQQKLRIQENDTTVSHNYSYDLTLVVLDTIGSKFKVSATYDNFEFIQIDDVTKQLIGNTENMEVVYQTDGFGDFKEILNSEEIIPKLKKGFDETLKKLKVDKNTEKSLNQFMVRYATKEGIEGGGVDELLYLHGGIGYQYVLGKEYDEQVNVANNMGGKPFDGTRTMTLLEIDTIERTAMLKIVTDIDGEQIRQASIGFIKSLLPPEKQSEFKEEEIPEMFIQHRLVNFFDFDYGWNLYSYNIKEIESGGILTQEITEIAIK